VSSSSEGSEADIGAMPTEGWTTAGEAAARERSRASLFGGVEVVKIGRFTALGKVGAGGMGVVYAAYDDDLDRKVAVKLLLDADPGTEERLKREARALAKLRHPNVVTVFEVGRHEGQLFVAMEFVDGQTLRRWWESESPDVDRILEVFDAAGQGLAAAHDAGLVHRDFKPENVMLGRDGIVRVLDFGLARAATLDPLSESQLEETQADTGADFLDSQPHTRSVGIAGTPPYMPREQWMGEPLDGAADQFAFCVSLWEALTGARPFQGSDFHKLFRNIAREKFVEGGRTPPPRIEAVLRRGLAPEPAERWPDMRSLLAALRPVPARSRWPLVALGSVVLVGVGLFAAARGAADPVSRCDEGRERVATVWNEEAKGGIHGDFAATLLPYAELASTRVVERIDVFTDAWATAFDDNCRAHADGAVSDSGFDLRMQCLSRQRDELGLLLAALRDADPATVDRATQAAAELPEVAECENIEVLRRSEDAVPDEQREQHDAIEIKLAEARYEQVLGHYEDARTLADAARTEADALGNGALVAETMLAQGSALDYLGQAEAATEHMRSALYTAMRNHAPETAARAAAGLVWLYGEVMGQLERAEDFADTGQALLEGLDEKNDEVAIELLNSLGAAYQTAARHDDSILTHQLALALARTHYGERHAKTARSLINLGNAHWGKGALDEVEERLLAAYAILLEEHGREHPTTLKLQMNLVTLSLERGELERAMADGTALAALQKATLGDKHPDYARTLNNLGNAARLMGDLEKSADLLERAAAIHLETEGPDSYGRLTPLENLARTYGKLGRIDEAIALIDEVRGIVHAKLGPESHQLAWTDQALGVILLDANRPADAEPILRRGLAIVEGSTPPAPISVSLEIALVDALLRQDARDEARKAHARVQALFDAGVHAPDVHARAHHADNAAKLAK
jgi:tetratricopeptide (TPR) repeat protein/predicted Ser/Thr protein kinase